ncbi:hypothetical protein QUW39_08670 [Lactobacillus crispatus]|uniref:hypothetical protein n=1 Tax=Lactobacillus crispatus TaxID=47770 RepID=UPI0025A4935E|nr:hypothetical protein [Lactobacillus crispatus]MDM8291343.1 hypothetical protein [Lactobacillus crispatus]
MKEITKRLLSATVAIGISFGAITALESQQVEASDINNSIYTANKDLAKAQKLLALLKDYQKGLTPQVKIIHEIETVPVPQPTTNTSTAEVSSNSTKSENIPQNDASHQPISKVKVSLKKKINTLQNHKSLPLKGKGYVALLKIKHSVSVVKINKTNKIIKLHAKAKRAKLYNIKEIKRINKQKWCKISSKNEWVNLKNFNLFKKID